MVYIAKGKENESVAVLESLRTASQLYYLDKGESFIKSTEYGEITAEQFKNLEKYLSENASDLVKDGKVVVEIGGEQRRSR